MIRFKKIKIFSQDNVAGYVFIGLFVIGFLMFYFFPLIMSLYYSFTNYNLISKPNFIGLYNYVKLFTKDPQFYRSLGVTAFYVVFSVPLRLAFALFIAMILKKYSRFNVLYRAAYYLPSIIGSSVAIAVVWRTMFSSQGYINSIINSILGTDIKTSWIGNVNTAIWTLIILAIWQYGSSMLIFLSGLKQIPTELYEAADIDGAGRVSKFIKITIPLLTPVIFFNLIMQTINAFMCFTQSYIITQGGPVQRTLFITVYIYQNSFSFQKMGYGSAMAWILLVIVAIVTGLMFKFSDKWVYNLSDGV